MAKWFARISKEPDNLDHILDALEWFDQQYEEGRKELITTGRRIENVCLEVPSLLEYRYGQTQELEAILQLLEIRESKLINDGRRKYSEHYARQLSDRTSGQYAENDPEIVILKEIRTHVALVRNKFLGLLAAYEKLHFSVGYVVKLRIAGFDDATF